MKVVVNFVNMLIYDFINFVILKVVGKLNGNEIK